MQGWLPVLPGPLICACLVLTVAIGILTALRPEVFAAMVFATAGVAVLTGRARVRRLAVAAALTGAGLAHGAFVGERALVSPLVRWFEGHAGPGERLDAPVLLDGALLTDAVAAEGGVHALVRVARVRDADGWHRAEGRVQMRVGGSLAQAQSQAWRAGRSIQTAATLRRPRVLSNYGGPSPRLQALRRPFDLNATVKSGALVEVSSGAWWTEAAAAVRSRVRGSLTREVSADIEDARGMRAAAVATAILIGDRAGLSEDIERRLQDAGTYHVIAISGGNIAVIAAIAFGMARALTRSARARSAVTLAAVASYGALVSPDPSVTRAVVAACVYLAVGLAGLAPRPLHVLAAVAAGVAIVDPLSTIDVGAWLSFGATLGILLMTARFSSWLTRRSSPRVRRFARPIVVLVAASAAAELVLFPIAAAVFGRLSLAGLVLNVVAIPAMAVLQASGLIVAAASGVWPAVAELAASVVRLSADALLESARLVDLLPWLSWRVPPAARAWTAVYYLAGAAVLIPVLARWRRYALTVALISALVVVTAPAFASARPPAGWLRLTMLDVGQGEALLAQLPSGHDLLVDAGGGPGAFDIGARVVTPAIWALGSRRLDWLAITHADLDHIGGAGAVLDDLNPREVWEGIPVLRDPALQRFLASARSRGIPRREIRRGDVLEAGGVTIEVCHPHAPDWERQRVRNDDSLVLRLRYGQVELLLTGDAGPEFERTWTAGSDRAPLRLLKAAHHGSRTSSAAEFLEAYRPQAVLVSAGRGNPFGHPAPAVLNRFNDVGADVFRTDRDGAITVETDGVVVRVRTALGRAWTLGFWRWPS